MTTLLIFMIIFEPETWIKQLILSILSELENHNYKNRRVFGGIWKYQMQTQVCERTCTIWASGFQGFTFPVHILLQDLSSFGLV